MKYVVASLVMAAMAVPLAAQAPAPAPAAAPAMITIDSPIEAIVADAKGKAVLDATFPGMTAHPAYEQFKGMTLKQLAPLSQGVITDEAIAKAEAALAAK
ncbi:MAG: hypothetical protein ACKVOJ_01350 [Sphingomonadaceae bacterium]